MKTARPIALIATTILFIGLCQQHAQAQDGCTDSPEASTDVLALVGSVGMVHGSLLFKKLNRRSRGR